MPDNPITLDDLDEPVNTGYDKANKYGDDDWATPPRKEEEKRVKKEEKEAKRLAPKKPTKTESVKTGYKKRAKR